MHQHLLRTDLQEIHPLCRPVRQYPRAMAAAGFRHMPLDQAAQLCFPMWLADGTGDQGFKVHEILGHAIGVMDIGHPPGHSRAKVGPDPPQNHCHAAGHILTAVRPAAFHDDRGTRVAHRKPLTRPPRREQIA